MIHSKQRYLILICLLIQAVYIQALSQTSPDWSRYHSTAETHAILKEWAEKYSSLVKIYPIGKTLKGTPLMMMEITNKETGNGSEKPAYYYDGNIHSGELTGAELILYFGWHLLSNYGKNDKITNLIDTRTFYLRPKFNPDGADIALTTYHSLRSTPRPYDEDRDGLLDEDPANDLDGNGVITRMRVRNPEGQWKTDSIDNRIMERRSENDKNGVFYDLYSEGIDDDEDGNFDEDGIGGIDMNRNFPRNWGMEFEQRGAGPYPLSEPETRATIEFLDKHRNITGIFHGHTSGGFLYRLPSTTAWENFDPADQNLILELSEKYHETTGQPVRPSYSDPSVHRHGTLISWGFWDFGVVGFVPEFWGNAGKDYNDDGNITETERLKWNDEELNGKGFVDWKMYNHPQLGNIEIGGWKSKFVFQNPPRHLLKNELELYLPWMIWLAEISPRISIKNLLTETIDNSNKIKITAVIENEGYLPTNLTKRALDAEIAAPVRVIIEMKDAELTDGKKRTEIGHLKGSRDSIIDKEVPESQKIIEYAVRVTGQEPVFLIKVISEKGER